MAQLRTFLALARVSTLPTLWSHSVAGWWLGGGGNWWALPFLLLGVTALYLAGSFMSDAVDAKFDREHRRARPIPAGHITQGVVLAWAGAWFMVGLGALAGTGRTPAILAVVLGLVIVACSVIHRMFVFAPVLMGLCRLLVYVIAASVAEDGVTGPAVWCGLALASYYIGVHCLRVPPQPRQAVQFWPLPLLLAPVLMALLLNGPGYREQALLLSAVLVLWTIYELRRLYWQGELESGTTIGGLHAGLVLVDWLAVAHGPRTLSVVFILLFLTALMGQKLPARSVPEHASAVYR